MSRRMVRATILQGDTMMFSKNFFDQQITTIVNIDANVHQLTTLTDAEQEAVSGAAPMTEYAILIGL